MFVQQKKISQLFLVDFHNWLPGIINAYNLVLFPDHQLQTNLAKVGKEKDNFKEKTQEVSNAAGSKGVPTFVAYHFVVCILQQMMCFIQASV